MKINGENFYVCSMLLNDELPPSTKKTPLKIIKPKPHYTHLIFQL